MDTFFMSLRMSLQLIQWVKEINEKKWHPWDKMKILSNCDWTWHGSVYMYFVFLGVQRVKWNVIQEKSFIYLHFHHILGKCDSPCLGLLKLADLKNHYQSCKSHLNLSQGITGFYTFGWWRQCVHHQGNFIDISVLKENNKFPSLRSCFFFHFILRTNVILSHWNTFYWWLMQVLI